MRTALAATLVMAALATPSMAEAQVTSVDDIDLGTYWYGPQFSKEDLKGRVVFMKMWGYN